MALDDTDKERLIRLEERVLNLQDDVRHINSTLTQISQTILSHEVTQSNNSLTISKGERLFWIVMSGVVGAIIFFVRNGGAG